MQLMGEYDRHEAGYHSDKNADCGVCVSSGMTGTFLNVSTLSVLIYNIRMTTIIHIS